MRQIKLKELELTEFTNHKAFNEVFGILNVIKGINGAGKSSIGDGVTWCLSGLDMMGSKLDPQPTDRETERTAVFIIFEVDGKEIKLMRELIKGKAAFYINDVPKKATEYNEVVYSLTGTDSIDLFLSLFNPSYFPSMHWQDQRNMILRYTTSPANSEVYKQLPQLQADKLKAEFKQNNIDDLDSIHKKNKTNKEKELIAAKSRVDTLEGQLEGVEPQDMESLDKELAEVKTWLKASQALQHDSAKVTTELITKEREAKYLLERIDSIKNEHGKVKEQDTCLSCGQDITEDKKREVCSGLNDRYKELKAKYQELQTEISGIEVPPQVDSETLNEVRARENELVNGIKTEQNRLKAIETIEAAKQAVTDVQQSLNDSIFILDAIKAFKGREAELQAEKVQGLFTTLSIRLWDEPKNGEKKPAFEIEMNGKPYSKLSLGEKARAGLELIEVLSEQSGIECACFIDNRESITSPIDNKIPQLILAVAAPETKDYDGKLIVEVDK